MYQGKQITIIGLGTTGLSCVDFFADKNARLRVIDTRANPAGADKLSPEIPLHTGGLNVEWLLSSDLIVISPGLALATPEIQQAIAAGVEVVGDIELFCREANAPIIAITGSNGKSTVTSLTTEMAKQAGLKVGMGGNIGVPALSLLKGDYELYVLELSSFQLETTHSLKAKSATVLNISEDHMDRYDSLEDYRQAKLKIYENAEFVIVNNEDRQTYPDLQAVTKGYSLLNVGYANGSEGVSKFSQEFANTSAQNFANPVVCFGEGQCDYALRGGALFAGEEKILDTSEMVLKGRHNEMNALAAMALAEKAGVPREGIVKALKSYCGLDHRFQPVPTSDGVRWVNDSKATNVGSTVAALNGLQVGGTLYLLLGGDGKGADFSELKPLINKENIICYCFGRDGAELAKLTPNSVLVETMAQAVEAIRPQLNAGDMVLLSPACASLDQFPNFEVRGKQFMQLAQGAGA